MECKVVSKRSDGERGRPAAVHCPGARPCKRGEPAAVPYPGVRPRKRGRPAHAAGGRATCFTVQF